MSDALISFYQSAKDQAPQRAIPVRDFVRMVREGDFTDGVNRVRSANSPEDAAAAKLKLPAVQLSGCVTSGNRARALHEGRFVHSGWMQLDVDDDGLNGASPEDARSVLASDPHTLCAFVTPSGKGAKALFRIRPCMSDDEHKAAFKAVEKYIIGKYGYQLDPATKDSGRLCFVAADPDCTWRPFPDEFAPPAQDPVLAPPAHRRTQSRFPAPPSGKGVHTWIMEAAWHCRLKERKTAAETTGIINGFSPELYRGFQPNEVSNAVEKVFSSPLPKSIFDHPAQSTSMGSLADFSMTDAGNAERVFAYAGGNFRYITESSSWILWDGKRWNPDTTGGMVRLFVSVMKETGKTAFESADRSRADVLAKHALRSLDSNRVTAGLQMLKSILGVSVSVVDLDRDHWSIGTADGIIDLLTGKPITPDPAKLITKSIGTHYDGSATCPTWAKFLHTVTAGDEELIGYLQAAVGYTLTGSNREQCLFFLHGNGSNGKGVFSETIKRLIGDYGQTAPETMFISDRNQSATNDVARLVGCRMAIAPELEEGVSFAETKIKKLTGNDTITARFLHQEFFDFVPTHHFWISGNHKPTIKGNDEGIWRRLRLIPFTVKISNEQKDMDLAQKLVHELPGILNWALDGCLKWQREGLITPQVVSAATDEYRTEEDVIGHFIDECTLPDTRERSLISSVYEAYQNWAEKGGTRYPLTARVFNRKLEERGILRIKSGDGRFWKGFALA
jgi:putative DNA primase/helicase